jgi:spermidine synthase|tara:strand:- start:317 stop:577 length:261 start_codon:yes stop_codon:yes gene_type:complete
MLKEIKYLVFIVIISIFIFFTGKYYFSDENIKNSYRSYKNIDEKVKIYSKNLPLLKNDTENIIEYVKQTDKKKKKKFNFWKLLEND